MQGDQLLLACFLEGTALGRRLGVAADERLKKHNLTNHPQTQSTSSQPQSSPDEQASSREGRGRERARGATMGALDWPSLADQLCGDSKQRLTALLTLQVCGGGGSGPWATWWWQE